MALYEIEEQKESMILVGIQLYENERTEESLDELAELAKTAGAEVAGRVIQKREAVHPVTYVGKGKLLELKEVLWETEATGIVCDDELTSVQLHNLERELECKVIDRTLLILDIFAARAVSSEGKIQVELAQLKYRAARLVGLRDSLSRLGGGIGTRGPGEKKLEMDRRLIRERISRLKKELCEVEQHRELIRTQRKASQKKIAALVGYTSAGKRTKRRGKASGINTDTEKTVGIKGGGFSRIYIGGKEQYRKCADWGWNPGGCNAFLDTGHDNACTGAGGKAGDSADGYGWFYPEAAPPFDRGV